MNEYEKAVALCYSIWRSIDWDNISASRRMKIYDEFLSKIKSATATKNLAKFAEKLCAKMGVRSFFEKEIVEIIKEDSPTVLKILREETQFIVILMREKIEKKKEERQCNMLANSLF